MTCHFCYESPQLSMEWEVETDTGMLVTIVPACFDHEHFVRNTLVSIDALPSIQREDG